MKITVFLYGTFRERFKDYQHHAGIDLEVPAGAVVKDMLSTLGISWEPGVAVVRNGRILKMEETMKDGSCLNIFQSIHGG